MFLFVIYGDEKCILSYLIMYHFILSYRMQCNCTRRRANSKMGHLSTIAGVGCPPKPSSNKQLHSSTVGGSIYSVPFRKVSLPRGVVIFCETERNQTGIQCPRCYPQDDVFF